MGMQSGCHSQEAQNEEDVADYPFEPVNNAVYLLVQSSRELPQE